MILILTKYKIIHYMSANLAFKHRVDHDADFNKPLNQSFIVCVFFYWMSIGRWP